MRTTRHLPWLLLSLLALLLSLPPSGSVVGDDLADPELPPFEEGHEGDVALIIAQEDYNDWPAVVGATANGEAWERYFRNSLGMTEVTLISDVNGRKIASLAEEAAAKAKKLDSERLWFVYVGHGSAGRGATGKAEPMLIGREAELVTGEDLKAYAVMRSDLLRTLASSGSEVVALLDACESGQLPGTQSAIPDDMMNLYYEVPKKVLVLAAAGPGETTGQLAEAARPSFSYLVLEAMSQGDADHDGKVTAAEALDYTESQLVRSKRTTKQTPRLEAADGELPERSALALAWPTRCEGGKVSTPYTLGNCCWPGQGWNGSKCTGTPESCPKGLQADGNDCVKAVAQASKPASTSGSGSVSAPSTASTQPSKASTGSSTTQTSTSGSNDTVSSSTSGSRTSKTAAAPVEKGDGKKLLSIPELPRRSAGHENDVALIIAQEDYYHWPDIPGAKANGEAWEQYFRESLGMTDVTLATDLFGSEIENEVAAASERAKKVGNARLWFVYVGHGWAEVGDSSPMFVDVSAAIVTRDRVSRYSTPRRNILETLAEGNREVVAVIDAAQGAFAGEQAALPGEMVVEIPTNVLVLAACSAGQSTGRLADEDRPAFSYLLLEGLNRADADLDGRVSAAEAIDYATSELETRLPNWARQTPRLETPAGKEDEYGKWEIAWP